MSSYLSTTCTFRNEKISKAHYLSTKGKILKIKHQRVRFLSSYRTCEPYHGFVILSTVSRETFVQVIKASMEFKHSPNYEAFLQYKVDVGGTWIGFDELWWVCSWLDIYGIWFISKTDCPRVTECLKRLTIKAKEVEQSSDNLSLSISSGSSDIFSLLNNAKEKFQETVSLVIRAHSICSISVCSFVET